MARNILVSIPWSSELRSSSWLVRDVDQKISQSSLNSSIRRPATGSNTRISTPGSERTAKPAKNDLSFMLLKKVKQLTIEREIFSKAAARFARETETLPKRSSDS